MALIDHSDVFTFALLNRPVAAGPGILTSAGFSPRKHLGRTVYLLPPHISGTSKRTGDAIGRDVAGFPAGLRANRQQQALDPRHANGVAGGDRLPAASH